MSDRTDNLISLLSPFGLSAEESKIYLDLLKNGVLTALQISRNIQIGRTKVYRILDRLIRLNLVSQQYDDSGMKFVANEPTQFDWLLTKRESELSSLRQRLPEVVTTLQRHMGSGEPGSKTLYYKGVSGLLQVNYNLLHAEGEFLSYEIDTAESYLSHADAEQLRHELVDAKIKTVTLTNKTHFPAFTDITKLVTDWWEIRYIDPEIFKVTADVFIYNNVYAMCNYVKQHDVFCVEIYNDSLASMQRQLFWNLWRQAVPLKILSPHGEAKLER